MRGLLAGGANKLTGKQIGQTGVVLPVGDKAPQQIRTTQQGAFLGSPGPQGDVGTPPRYQWNDRRAHIARCPARSLPPPDLAPCAGPPTRPS